MRLRSSSSFLPSLVSGLIAACTFSANPAAIYGQTRYDLSVKIEPEKHVLQAEAVITPDFTGEIKLLTEGLTIGKIKGTIQRRSAEFLSLQAQKGSPLRIEYRIASHSPAAKSIQDDSIELSGIWFPVPEDPVVYNLSAELPEGFVAISSANQIRTRRAGSFTTFQFQFPEKQDHLHLIASTRYAVTRSTVHGIDVYTYFFKKDADLAPSYMKYTKEYLKRYIEILGPYPYKRFSVVESSMQVGHAMPTFTLLGDRVVRLPFIVHTSLGHEVVHQWLGNHVRTPREGGNWAEGLTTYLSDHLYRKDQGEGPEHRKEFLTDYEAYVDEANEIPLSEFQYRKDRATSAIGYGKAAVLFHMLAKDSGGEEEFYKIIREFIQKYGGKSASFQDLLALFRDRGVTDVDRFYRQWVESPGLFSIQTRNALYECADHICRLGFDAKLEGPQTPLDLPLLIQSDGGSESTAIRIDPSKTKGEFQHYTLKLDRRPQSVLIDPAYEIPRRLTERESPPTVSRLLNQEKIVIVSPDENPESVFLHRIFHGKEIRTVKPEDLKVSEIRNETIVFTGEKNPALSPVYGFLPPDRDAGFQISIRPHPWNQSKLAVWIHAKNETEIQKGGRKIFHYGRYSDLSFAEGTNQRKDKFSVQNGIDLKAKRAPIVIQEVSDPALDSILFYNRFSRVFYLGEQHDQHSHHHIQLEMIRRLYQKHGENLVLGMEMFQKPFQKELDRYVEGKISEKEFLLNTEYFSRWGFDYHLYRPIIQYAKEKGIRILALNIEREVIRSVSKNGVHGIGDELQTKLAGPMDFSDQDYRKFLSDIFSRHGMSKMFEGNPERFENFLQSQVIWDESMARVIADALNEQEDQVVAVLVGGGHLRYRRGIPHRVKRMSGEHGVVVLNDDEGEPGVSDYIILPEKKEGPSLPTLGVKIKQIEAGMHVIEVEPDSPAHEAGMKQGDTIVQIESMKTDSMDRLKVALFFSERGKPTTIRVLRKDKDVKLKVVFPEEKMGTNPDREKRDGNPSGAGDFPDQKSK